jgi:hypothetical protein
MEKLLEDKENMISSNYTGRPTAEQPSNGDNQKFSICLQSGSWRTHYY